MPPVQRFSAVQRFVLRPYADRSHLDPRSVDLDDYVSATSEAGGYPAGRAPEITEVQSIEFIRNYIRIKIAQTGESVDVKTTA